MRKIAIALAAAAALAGAPGALAAPAPPTSSELTSVASGVLTFVSAPGEVDAVTIGDFPGSHFVNDSQTPTGLAGAGCSAVSGETYFVCSGATSADVRTQDGDDFVYVMSALPSTVDAGSGADTVWGGAGNDVLRGGTEADELRGGAGDDRIDARDGFADTVDCGPGDDRAVVDASDVVSGCEVDPAPLLDPVVDPPLVTEPIAAVKKADPPGKVKDRIDVVTRAVEDPLPPVSPVTLVSAAVSVGRDGLAPLELGCAATEVAGCSGDVFLDPAPAVRPGKGPKGGAPKGAKGPRGRGRGPKARAARRGRFGKSPFQIAAGRRQNLKVRLSAEARAKLGLPRGRTARAARRGRRVKAVVTVVQRGKAPSRSIVELRG